MSKKEDINPEKIQISEMFMAQADHERCFYGIIQRGVDEFGNAFVFSRIVVNDGLIQAKADNQWELGKNLDEICKMVLDMGLHDDAGVYTEIFGSKYFLN
ncbi:MAG: hypothetical protein NTV31_07545 [Bacteroidia bacterium]|nr:hypothetical protein [Bacteroidia bacterium]